MSDFDQIRVSGSTFNEFSISLTRAIQSLPPEQRDRLSDIRSNCFHAYGFHGTHHRLNNKTVAQILAEFANATPPSYTIAEGEINGVRYKLTEPPSDQAPKNDAD